ncbi:MAG: hypothetical protein AAFR67_00320, partial [Chloroflexota bacterium]
QDRPDIEGIENRNRFTYIQGLYALLLRFDDEDIASLEHLDITMEDGCSIERVQNGERLIESTNEEDEALVNAIVCNIDELLQDFRPNTEFGTDLSSFERLGAELYFYLANLALKYDVDLCPQYIEIALEQNPERLREMFYHGLVAECHFERGDYEAAINSANSAIDLATLLDANENDLRYFQDIRNRAMGENSGNG